MSRETRVGALVVIALGILALGVFLIGERSQLFQMKNRYSIRFVSASGLAAGNPVKLNGVTVGQVQDVVLPESIEDPLLTVWITIERRFADRVREDSLARIKTLGLLGDKYIEISSGSASATSIESGGEIPAAPATDVDQLIASGEDAVANFVAISYSLRAILGKIERGEGLLGDLLVNSEAAGETRQAVTETLASLRSVVTSIDRGDGLLGAMVSDRELARRTEASLTQLETALSRLVDGSGPIAALLNDEDLKRQIAETVANAETASQTLAGLSRQLEEGHGLAGRLLLDDELADAVARDLRRLLENLTAISAKLESGEGTLGRLIDDPHLYEAVDDIVVGIDESRLLRWLIRNRQRAGIRERYDEARTSEPGAATSDTVDRQNGD